MNHTRTLAPRTTDVAPRPESTGDDKDVRRSVERLIDSAKRFTRDMDEAGMNERDRAEFFFD